MHFSWQAWFFITLLLFSGLLVNGLIIPSFAVQPIPNPCAMHLCKIEQGLISPLKQFKTGIPLPNIFCKTGLVLVFKKSDNSPACVKPDTAQKLVERGWGSGMTQTAWFELKPIQCQSPWEEYARNAPNRTGVFPNVTLVQYFKDNG